MSELSRQALRDAMAQRRSFMTLDKNASIQMLGEGRCWMGSRLAGLSTLAVKVEVQDPDANDGFEAIEIYGPGQALLSRYECGGASTCFETHDVDVDGATYVVARALQVDGDALVAAPLWVKE
jgi:hypothetical protein